MKRIILPFLLIVLLLISACSNASPAETGSSIEEEFGISHNEHISAESSSGEETTAVASMSIPIDTLFSERDLSGTYDNEKAVNIILNANTISCGSDSVDVIDNSAVIKSEGTYIVSGVLENGSLIVDASKEDKIQIVLDNASIHSETQAPIYIKQADKVFVTLAPESENIVSNGGIYENDDDTSVDAVIFSKDDLTLNGEGRLNITAPVGHGIVSKDELTVCGGNITIDSASHGLSGKDSVSIVNTALNITAGKDGIHAENKDDAELGYLYIESGTVTVNSDGDCISAANAMQIDSGEFTLVAGGGSANAEEKTAEYFGGMGGMVPPGGMGGKPPKVAGGRMMAITPTANINNSISETDDTVSMKAIKSGASLSVHGGNFTIDSADDAVHSNADLYIYSGNFIIKTGDDGFHADAALEMHNGTIDIQESYEGIEGKSIRIIGSDIVLSASDDGLNAAGGTDQSGFGGMHGGDRFAADSDCFIEISGGILHVRAMGDGIDSNGSLSITGGETVLCGPTAGDTAVLDYASTGTISGGTFIATGSSMMAQALNSETQGIIALRVGNQTAGTTVTLSYSDGTEVLSVTPELDFEVVLFSCPKMHKGESFTVTIGSVSQVFDAQ